MTYETAFVRDFRRWRLDCHRGRTHKPDEFQQRQLWMDGEVRRLILCSWCGTWSASRNLTEDLLDSWTEAAKRYWREHHPR